MVDFDHFFGGIIAKKVAKKEMPMVIKVPEGTVIMREGEANMDMYKIISGNIELYRGYETKDEAIIGIKSKGDYFGEMGLLTGGKPAIYTAVAYSDVLLLRITEKNIDDFILKNHVDVLRIMQGMANTMYNIKFSMDMILDDMADKESGTKLKEFKGFYFKQLAMYNYSKMMDPFLRVDEKV